MSKRSGGRMVTHLGDSPRNYGGVRQLLHGVGYFVHCKPSHKIPAQQSQCQQTSDPDGTGAATDSCGGRGCPGTRGEAGVVVMFIHISGMNESLHTMPWQSRGKGRALNFSSTFIAFPKCMRFNAATLCGSSGGVKAMSPSRRT